MNFSTCESLVQGQAVNITPVWFTIKCEVHTFCVLGELACENNHPSFSAQVAFPKLGKLLSQGTGKCVTFMYTFM